MKQFDFSKIKRVLNKYKIQILGDLVKNEKQLIDISNKLEFPAVLKVIAKDIIHKSDLGLIKTNIQNQEELLSVYNNLIKKSKKHSKKIDGILVQPMIKGTEVIIGIKNDFNFGSVILFGSGGILVELIKDTSFRIAPIKKDQAEEMIQETKVFQLLKGLRGEKEKNIKAVINLLTKISNLAEKEKIQELDLNPVIVNEKDCFVVDVRIMENEN